eukprot:764811-Hanusia_phi.AAC.4
MDPNLVDDLLLFARLIARWLLRVADAPPTILPLPPKPSAMFKAIPEFCVEGVTDILRMVAQTNIPTLELMGMPTLQDLFNFLMVFSSNDVYIKNPYLRGKLLEVMSLLIPRGRNEGFELGGGSLATLFEEHDIARKFLVPTLIRFYVDIEVTGRDYSNNQFYEKFHYRHYMAELLMYIMKFPYYITALKKESENVGEFVRFINMMLNDIIHCIDEGLLKLADIRKIEFERADTQAWNAKPEEERNQEEQHLQTMYGQAGWGLQAATEVLTMMEKLTKHVLDPFLRAELADRVAAMLNYVLKTIAGPRCIELKVQHPEKCYFKPKELLALVVEVFMNLAKHDKFALAVVRDERSYDHEVRRSCISFPVTLPVRTHALEDESFCQQFLDYMQVLQESKQSQMELDAKIEEAPDE